MLELTPEAVERLKDIVESQFHKDHGSDDLQTKKTVCNFCLTSVPNDWHETSRYSPFDWNEYPKTMPPVGVPMRIEYSGIYTCAVWDRIPSMPEESPHAYGWWLMFCGQKDELLDDGFRKDFYARFRPWD